MKTLRPLVARHPVLTFFALAYGLSWLGAIAYVLAGFPIPILPFGPFLAALVVAPLVGGWAATKTLLLRMVQWRAGWQWYAMALLLPVTVTVAAVYTNVWLGAPPPSADFLFSQLPNVVPVFALLLLSPFSGSLGEEPGWRGFALPRLLVERSPLVASLILGILVAAWHAPLFLTGMYGQVGVRVLFIVTTTILYTLLFKASGGSVLLAMLFHTGWNAAPELLIPAFSGADVERFIVLYSVIGTMVAVAAAMLAARQMLQVPIVVPARVPAVEPSGV